MMTKQLLSILIIKVFLQYKTRLKRYIWFKDDNVKQIIMIKYQKKRAETFFFIKKALRQEKC